ncbi:MAG: hypothetical protein M5U28_54645 [Sandaracinaceae bacterium]|nr:hypothetical protein [Sandaracinaceae bacterium]
MSAAGVHATLRRWLPPRRRLVLVGVASPGAPPEGRVRVVRETP